jgi:Fusaric acid resistance protein-like
MRPMFGRLLDIDREKLDVRLAVYALTAIAVASAFEAIIGVGALQTGVAAVVVMAAGRGGTLRTRLVRMGVVTLVGGAFGFFSYVSAETAWQAALVLAVVSYVTGLAYRLGPSVGRAGYVLLLWTVAVLIGEAHGGDPPETAAAFLIGGAAAMALLAVATGVRSRLNHASDPASVEEPRQSPPGFGELVRSDVGVWSFLRAALVFVGVLIGYALTEDLDPFWTVIVLLIVFQPDSEQTVFKAAQRGLGTVAGAATAAALLGLTSSEPVIIALVLVAAFGAVAFYNANYMIYAFFLTNAVLLYYWLAADHDVSGPALRLAATIIGIALAFGGMVLLTMRAHRNAAPATAKT